MDNEILEFLNLVSIAIFDKAPTYFSELNLQQKDGKYVSVLHRDGKEAKSKGKEKTIIKRCTSFAKIYETDDYQKTNCHHCRQDLHQQPQAFHQHQPSPFH